MHLVRGVGIDDRMDNLLDITKSCGCRIHFIEEAWVGIFHTSRRSTKEGIEYTGP
jgi:hypothetical protein